MELLLAIAYEKLLSKFLVVGNPIQFSSALRNSNPNYLTDKMPHSRESIILDSYPR